MCHIPIVLCTFLVYFRFFLRLFFALSPSYVRRRAAVERRSSGHAPSFKRPCADFGTTLHTLQALQKPCQNTLPAKLSFLLGQDVSPQKNNQITFHFSLLGTFAGPSFPSLRTRGKPYMRPASHLILCLYKQWIMLFANVFVQDTLCHT